MAGLKPEDLVQGHTDMFIPFSEFQAEDGVDITHSPAQEAAALNNLEGAGIDVTEETKLLTDAQLLTEDDEL